MEFLSALLGLGLLAGFLLPDGDANEDPSSTNLEDEELDNGPDSSALTISPTVEAASSDAGPNLVRLEQASLTNSQNDIHLTEGNSSSLYVNTPLDPKVNGVWNVYNFDAMADEIILEANSLNTHINTGASYVPDLQIIENSYDEFTDVILKSIDTGGDEWVQTLRLHGSLGVTEDNLLIAEQGEIDEEYDGDHSELKEYRSFSHEFTEDVSGTHISGSDQADVLENVQLKDSRLFANEGDDRIAVFAENASIFAGEGDDQIDLRLSSDDGGSSIISGGPGDDKISTNMGVFVDGGEGADEISILIDNGDLNDVENPARIDFDYQQDALEFNFSPDISGNLKVLFDGPHFSGNGSSIRFDVSIYYCEESSEGLTKVAALEPHYLSNPLIDQYDNLALESYIESYQSTLLASIQTNLQGVSVLSKDEVPQVF